MPPDNDPYTIDEKTVERLLRATGEIDVIGQHVGRIRGARSGSSGSLSEADNQLPHSGYIRGQATIAVSVAYDHLRAWSLIIEGGTLPNYAPMTLVRTALETSALCRWLVDPTLSSMERVARGVSAQLEDHDQRRKFETAIGAGEPPEDGAARGGGQRLRELMRLRDAEGIPPLMFPGPTAIVGMYPPNPKSEGTWPYRLASAFSHGKMWSLVGMNLGSVRAARESGQSIPLTSDQGILASMTELAVAAAVLAVQDIEGYLGIGGPGPEAEVPGSHPAG